MLVRAPAASAGRYVLSSVGQRGLPEKARQLAGAGHRATLAGLPRRVTSFCH
jgi:hypothetical protein